MSRLSTIRPSPRIASSIGTPAASGAPVRGRWEAGDCPGEPAVVRTGLVVGADGADMAEGDRVGMAVADMPAMPSVAAPLSLVMLLPWLLVVNETVLLI